VLPLRNHATGIESSTVEATRRDVHPLLKKTGGVLYKGSPRWDPKTLGICTYQRREIRAWIRHREVEILDPQLLSVPVVSYPSNPLFINIYRVLLKFSRNI